MWSPTRAPCSVRSTSTRFIAGEPMNPATKMLAGLVVEVARGVDLLQEPVLEQRDPVAHGHGLDLVVGDVDGGGAEPALQRGDLGAGLHAQLGVEVGQRLVHEEALRLAHDRPAHRDALALPAGQRLGLAVEVVGEVEDLRGLLDAGADLGLVHAGDLQREAHVVRDGHVRVEGVVLEDHRDVAVLRRDVGDVAVADADRAAVDLLEAGEHPQAGRLPASGGADQDEELAVGDVEVQRVDRGPGGAGIAARGVVERDRCHAGPRRFGGVRGSRYDDRVTT